MLFYELVETSETVRSTRSRRAKIEALADLLGRLELEEIRPAIGFLTGEPRQGKVGVGWATVSRVGSPAAAEAVLTVGDVDNAIASVRETAGPGSTAERVSILAALLGRATEPEADFLRRLFVGELRQGALEGVMVEAVAKAAGVPSSGARRALMLSGDLGETAEIAFDRGEEGLAAVGLEVLRPVMPMLASTAEDVVAALERAGMASVEWKLDGARIQAHRDGMEVRVFTRNLNDVTERVPEVVSVVQDFPARRLVLDGETLTLGEDGRPRAFQDSMSRFGRERELGASLSAFFFDCLHIDGSDLIDLPLGERLAVLDRIVGNWCIPRISTADPDEATAFLDGALEAGQEGVMVKGLNTTYEAGRRGKAWFKVKPVQTFDLVVLAADWGHGRRRGWLSNLHLGARDPEGGFVMVGKTFKGMTDEMLEWQTAKLRELKSGQSGITVHVRPELVVEIALDAVQASSRYPGGVALRFARVKRYREDKDAAEADTIDVLRSLLPASSAGGVEVDEARN